MYTTSKTPHTPRHHSYASCPTRAGIGTGSASLFDAGSTLSVPEHAGCCLSGAGGCTRSVGSRVRTWLGPPSSEPARAVTSIGQTRGRAARTRRAACRMRLARAVRRTRSRCGTQRGQTGRHRAREGRPLGCVKGRPEPSPSGRAAGAADAAAGTSVPRQLRPSSRRELPGDVVLWGLWAAAMTASERNRRSSPTRPLKGPVWPVLLRSLARLGRACSRGHTLPQTRVLPARLSGRHEPGLTAVTRRVEGAHQTM